MIWQREKNIYLTHLKLDKYLTKDKLVNPIGNTDVFIYQVLRFESMVIICVNVWYYALLIDPLYAFYSQKKSSKYLWVSLKKNHKADVMKCQILNSKPTNKKIDLFHSIFCELTSKGILLCNIFNVNCFIEKLLASWVNFWNIWGTR